MNWCLESMRHSNYQSQSQSKGPLGETRALGRPEQQNTLGNLALSVRLPVKKQPTSCAFIRRPSSVWPEIEGCQGIFALVDGFFMHQSWTAG